MIKNVFRVTLLAAVLVTAACKKESTATEVKAPEQAIDAPAEAERFAVDTTASVIAWTGTKPTGSHTGTIKLKSGEIFIKNDSVTSGSFVINMVSIEDTDLTDPEQKQNLENHLKGLKEDAEDHFFNTNKYPEGKFEITGIDKQDGKVMVHGNLTLKNIEKNISFPATINTNNSMVTLVSEPFKIDRTLWNVNYNSKSVFKNLGNQYIDDEIELIVKVKATKG